MSKNFVSEGLVLDYTNTGSAVIYSGSVVVMGDLIGVSITNIPAGKVGAVRVEGVFALPKAADTALTLQGAAVYWDTAAKLVVAAEGTDIVPAGVVARVPASGATAVEVKLNA